MCMVVLFDSTLHLPFFFMRMWVDSDAQHSKPETPRARTRVAKWNDSRLAMWQLLRFFCVMLMFHWGQHQSSRRHTWLQKVSERGHWALSSRDIIVWQRNILMLVRAMYATPAPSKLIQAEGPYYDALCVTVHHSFAMKSILTAQQWNYFQCSTSVYDAVDVLSTLALRSSTSIGP